MSKSRIDFGGPGLARLLTAARRLAVLWMVWLAFSILGTSPAKACGYDVAVLGVSQDSAGVAMVTFTGGKKNRCDHYNVAWSGGGGRLQQHVPGSWTSMTWCCGLKGAIYTVSVQACDSGCGRWAAKKFVSCGTRGLPCGHPRLDAPPPMKIVSRAGLCLDVHLPDQFKNGARVQMFTCFADAPQQTWIIDKATRRIISLAGKCLDVDAGKVMVDGTPLQVFDCNGGPQQQWVHDTRRDQFIPGFPSPPGANFRTDPIRSAAGKCIDVHRFDQLKNGAKVQIWTCNDEDQQSWSIVPM